MYPFRSFLDVYLNHGYTSKFGYLEGFTYFNDSEDLMDSSENQGFASRQSMFLKEGTTDGEYSDTPINIMGKIFSNLTSTSYPILSNVTARIELTFNTPEFYMQDFGTDAATKQYRLKCFDGDLLLPVKALNLGLYADLELKLNANPLTYPLKRIKIDKFPIAKGHQTWIVNNLNPSTINPDRICFFFLPGILALL